MVCTSCSPRNIPAPAFKLHPTPASTPLVSLVTKPSPERFPAITSSTYTLINGMSTTLHKNPAPPTAPATLPYRAAPDMLPPDRATPRKNAGSKISMNSSTSWSISSTVSTLVKKLAVRQMKVKR